MGIRATWRLIAAALTLAIALALVLLLPAPTSSSPSPPELVKLIQRSIRDRDRALYESASSLLASLGEESIGVVPSLGRMFEGELAENLYWPNSAERVCPSGRILIRLGSVGVVQFCRSWRVRLQKLSDMAVSSEALERHIGNRYAFSTLDLASAKRLTQLLADENEAQSVRFGAAILLASAQRDAALDALPCVFRVIAQTWCDPQSKVGRGARWAIELLLRAEREYARIGTYLSERWTSDTRLGAAEYLFLSALDRHPEVLLLPPSTLYAGCRDAAQAVRLYSSAAILAAGHTDLMAIGVLRSCLESADRSDALRTFLDCDWDLANSLYYLLDARVQENPDQLPREFKELISALGDALGEGK